MKLLFLGNEIYNNRYKSLYKSIGVETMHYKNPLKAIDNLTEIEPDILFFKKQDYPRLWKIVLSGLRELFDDKKTIFILEGELDKKETKAFNYLKGSLILDARSDAVSLVKAKIQERFKPELASEIYYPDGNEICLGFVKPDDYSFITGQITMMSSKKFIFVSENDEDITSIVQDTIINEASISRGDEVVSVNFRIININKKLTCELLDDSTEYNSLTNSLFV